MEGIPDEGVRESNLKALKAGSDALKNGFDTIGNEIEPDPESPTEGLDKMAKDYAKEHNVTYEKAYDHVIETEKGRELYASSLKLEKQEASA